MTTTETRTVMTEGERQRRARSIHRIRRSQQMEGEDLTPFARGMLERYINGDITLTEAGRQLKEHHGIRTF